MSSQLAYGFKARAERVASAKRSALGLRALDRCDPAELAALLGVAVCSLSELIEHGADKRSVDRLSASETGFSAMTVFAGDLRLIVYNEEHPIGRRANSLTHECSHVVLGHPPVTEMFANARRMWDGRMEEEADWLAAAILVPRDGALSWLLNGGDILTGAEHFGVSRPLFQWRVNQTGIMRQLSARQPGRRGFA